MSKTYILHQDIITTKAMDAAVGAAFFIIATTLGAYVRIPLGGNPVPITLQTFFVMLAGAILGRRLGVLSQAGYIMLGVLGLPVFQGYSFGAAYLLGPTGGYLAGFALAAYFLGRMTGPRNLTFRKVIVYFIIGDLIIHLSGTLWLSYLYKMGLFQAISMGIMPFIPGEIVKILFAAMIYSKISRRSKIVFSP